MRTSLLMVAGAAAVVLMASNALAQDAPSDAPADPTGAPPPDAKALVSAPTSSADSAPTVDTDPKNTTTATVSAGGQWATGNSQLLAGTINGDLQLRRGMNGFGANVLGNYGQGAPGDKDSVLTSQNIQGRLRYDRYLLEKLSVFLILTGRYDRFQGLDFRLNVDPGVKYLFVNAKTTQLWGEAGYDFQYDIRRNADRVVYTKDADGNQVPQVDPATGQVVLLDKTHADHSARLFAGFKHAFNKEVSLTTGLEYLQSFVDSTAYRLNYDALVAANLGGGFSFGLGFTARYDHNPLPQKKDLDTTTTINLIYAFSDVPEPPPDCSKCKELEPPPPPPPEPEVAPAPPAETKPADPQPAPVPTPPVQTMVPPSNSPDSTNPQPTPAPTPAPAPNP